jgi:hypothetical protein
MTNPLIQKWEEIYGKKEEPEKKETPNFIKAENPKINVKAQRTGLKSYDPQSLQESFIETAFKVKTGLAQVVSMNMERDIMDPLSVGSKITFEVYVHKF